MRLALIAEDKLGALAPDARPVLFDVPEPVAPAILMSVGEAIAKALAVLGDRLMTDSDRLASFLIEASSPSTELVRERFERLKTIDTLMVSTEWLTAADIQSRHQGHPRIVADWKRRGRIFSVRGPDGKDLYPAYQFDTAMQPLPVIKKLLLALGPIQDPWTLVAWFHFPNAWLSMPQASGSASTSPKDRLGDEAALLEAARQRQGSFVA